MEGWIYGLRGCYALIPTNERMDGWMEGLNLMLGRVCVLVAGCWLLCFGSFAGSLVAGTVGRRVGWVVLDWEG